MNKNLKISNLALILLGLKVLYCSSTIAYSIIIDNLLLLCGCIVGIIYIISHYKMNLKVFFIILGVSIILFFSSIMSKNSSLIITWITILLIKDKPINEFVKLNFSMKLFFIIFHLLYSFIILIIDPKSILLQYSDGIRISFFTLHPNIFSSIVIWTIMEWFWLKFDTIKIKDIMAFVIITLVTYMCTKTDAIIIICFIFIVLFSIYKSKYCKILNNISRITMPFFIIITFWGIRLYNTSFGSVKNILNMLDILLSRRISASAYAESIFNYTLFGQVLDLSKVGWSDEYQLSGVLLDNLYISIAFRVGIIILILITISFYKLSNFKKEKISIFIIMFCVYGLVETQELIIYYCFVLSFIKYLLNNKMIDEILR